MPFDPTLPANNSALSSAVMRGQLTGLKALIDAMSGVTSAVVDAVNVVDPGTPASVSVSVVGAVLHLSLDIPRGNDGEVSQAALDAAIAGTSNNTNGVGTLDSGFGDPDAEALWLKVNELILAARR